MPSVWKTICCEPVAAVGHAVRGDVVGAFEAHDVVAAHLATAVAPGLGAGFESDAQLGAGGLERRDVANLRFDGGEV